MRGPQWQVVIWMQGLFSILCLLLLGMVWFNIHVLEFPFTTTRFRIFTVCGMVCFTVSSIVKCYHETVHEYNNENAPNFWISSVIYSLAWVLGQIFVYFLFIERLIYSFSSTKYALPRKYYYPFYVGIFIFGITNLIFQVLRILWRVGVLTQDVVNTVYDVRDIIETIVDFAVSISLLYIFIHKLWSLNADLYIFDNNSDKQKSDRDSLNNRQKSVIKIASKLTVISCVAIISTQTYLLLKTSIFSLCKHSIECNHWDSQYFAPFTATLWTVDCFINSLCIFISSELVMAETMYLKLCYCCDRCCNRCCQNIAHRKAHKKRNAAHELQVTLLKDYQL